jgi:GT2 family glycosyltransferase
MKRGVVSTIIPTYNRADLLRRAVMSASGQTYRDHEIIVVDDGSTDGTAAMISSEFPSVTYIKQQRSGVVAARNSGISVAQGEFVALLDSDDAWLPWKLDLQIAVLRAMPDVVLTWTDAIECDDRGVVSGRRFLRRYLTSYSHFDDAELFATSIPVDKVHPALDAAANGTVRIGDLSSSIFMGNLILTPTVVFRRSVLSEIGTFDSSTNGAGEDYHFFARVCQCGPVALVDVPAAFIRSGGSDHLRANRTQMAASNLMTVLGLSKLRAGKLTLPQEKVRNRLADSFGWLGECLFDEDRIREARRPLLEAVRHGSRKRRVFAYLALSYLPPTVTKVSRSLWSTTVRPRKEGALEGGKPL